ncbi:MAG: hypothetical protein A2W23_03760 [Planctomycetes bacterium RBG_16_43_13]|nr:MAG: hypothetical protein A2W23_03760 [Planctomycetes bacterium RBG_16_43_13]
MSYNLFIQLEGYALNREKTDEENLVTEIFVYLLNSSKHLQKKFLSHLLADQRKSLKKKLLRQFRNPEIESQVPSGDSIFDISIYSKNSDERIIIENKVGSKPCIDQIRKYLKSNIGYVALLTPTNVNSVNQKNRRYLGHFCWKDVYKIIKKMYEKQGSEIMGEFMKYMEEKNMGPLSNFTEKEIANAATGYGFITKAEKFVEEVKCGVEPYLCETFNKGRSKIKLKSGNSNPDRLISYYFYPPPKGREKYRMYLGFGIQIYDDERPYFFIRIGVWTKKRRDIVEKDHEVREKAKKLKRKGWEQDKRYPEWILWKVFEMLSKKDADKLVKEMVNNTKNSIEKLRSIRLMESIRRALS